MTEFLSEQFWNERYLSGQTGWDMGEVSPPLKAYFDQLEDKELAILIPGCGNAYEAKYLAEAGFKNVTVVDIAETPLQHLRAWLHEQKIDSVQLVHANFFDLEGSYDLMIEQTFFCALDPSLRDDYVRKTNALLAPKGKLVGLLFASYFEQGGPPFGGVEEEYRRLFAPYFAIEHMEPSYNSHPKRMGNELFIRLRPLQ